MSTTYTTNTHLALQATGEDSGTWGDNLNANVFTILDNVLGGAQTISLSSTDVTLTTTQTQNNFILLTGILTANVHLFFPAIGRTFAIVNNTTGDFTVTLAITGAPGAVAVIPQGDLQNFVMDATNVYAITGGAPASGSITNSQLVNMAANTIKGNNAGTAGSPSDLTGVQTTALLSAFAGDSGAGGVKGLVPAPAGGDAAKGKAMMAGGAWGYPGIGVGQAWQSVSRATGTVYQNTTGRSIVVSATAGNTTTQLQVGPNGTAWLTIASSEPYYNAQISGIIPPGQYYRITGAASGWVELR